MPSWISRQQSTPSDAPTTTQDEGALVEYGSNAQRIDELEAHQSESDSSQVTVEAGDSLWGIAAEFLGDGGRWTDLAETNGLDSPYAIQPGQVLTLPGSSPVEASTDTDTAVLHDEEAATGRTSLGSDDGDRALLRHLSEQETPLSERLPVERGASGETARLVQEQLVTHGAELEIDGVFGTATEDMIRAFQFANGLAVSGVVHSTTAALLYMDTANSIDTAKLQGVPGIAIGAFETWDAGELTGTTDIVLLDGVRLAAWLAPHWAAMRDAAATDGVTLEFNSSVSGFRTPADQDELYERYGSPRAVPSGWSNHQDGHAIDIVMSTAVEAWMSAHAGEYGFIRPTYEDWHWEYQP